MAKEPTSNQPSKQPSSEPSVVDTPKFKLAWARIVARAAFDEAFRNRVLQDPAPVFAEYDVTSSNADEIKTYVSAHLQPALDAIAVQRSAQEAADTSGRSISCWPSTGTATQATATATQACGGLPCWMGQAGTAAAGSGGAGPGAAVTSGRSISCWPSTGTATQATGATATQACGGLPCWMGQAGGTAAGLGGADAGAAAQFNCWGSAACIGSAGSWCGTAGTVGTGGTFGCGGGAQQMQLAAGQATMGGAAAQFNCVGSIGTAGCIGSWCGTAGSAATVGTFGSAAQQMAAGQGADDLSSGATLGSFATYCGCIGGGQGNIGSPATWGTIATSAF
jgi:hypothetical protein